MLDLLCGYKDWRAEGAVLRGSGPGIVRRPSHDPRALRHRHFGHLVLPQHRLFSAARVQSTKTTNAVRVNL